MAPMSGRPSTVHGREPTHSSWRWSRSAPLSSGRAASTMAWMRRWSSAASGLRNSIMPATRRRSPTGVHATRCGREVDRAVGQVVDGDAEGVAAAGLDDALDAELAGQLAEPGTGREDDGVVVLG